MTLWRLEELFPHQLEERLAVRPALVLPFGTIEWHSHHLPLGLDGLVAAHLCAQVAERSEAVLAPVSYSAVGGVPYPYTLNLTIAQIEPLLVASFEQFGAMGFRVLVAFTGHFGLEQTLTLKRAALTVMQRSPVMILPVTEYDLVTDIYRGDHAAVGETSLMLAMRPDLVRLGEVMPEQRLDGIIGADPRGAATVEQGRHLVEEIVARTSSVLLNLLYHMSALQRAEYIEALRAGTRVLERLVQLRETQPKRMVPPVLTPAYAAYCEAMSAGDYAGARAHAERKLADLTQ